MAVNLAELPNGFGLVPDGDFNEKVQPGDYVWDDDEWVKADRHTIGKYCCDVYTARALPKPAKKSKPKRIMRRRPASK